MRGGSGRIVRSPLFTYISISAALTDRGFPCFHIDGLSVCSRLLSTVRKARVEHSSYHPRLKRFAMRHEMMILVIAGYDGFPLRYRPSIRRLKSQQSSPRPRVFVLCQMSLG